MNLTAEELLKALSGELPSEDVTRLTGELRSLPSSSVLEVAAQSGIRVTGDGNIIGNNNVSVVVKGEGAAELASALREILMIGRALHQLPPPPRDFTGREAELSKLREHLAGGTTIVGVQGMGGVGKTALALRLADELKKDYPDAQFFLDLRGFSKDQRPLTAVEAMAHVIRAYYSLENLPEDEGTLNGLYRSALEGKRVLLLWDNAAVADQVAPLVPPTSCMMLVISRSHFAISGLYPVNLGAMEPAEACALLLKIEPRIGDEADAIAKLCGYLPLALELAASALKVKVNIEPAEYSARLTDVQKRRREFGKVEASLIVSYDLLSAEQQRLWHTLAVFPDTFDHKAAAAIWEMASEDAQDVLGELISYSLVEWNKEAGRYRLHDLARDFANTQSSESELQAAKLRHAQHFLELISNIDHQYRKYGERIEVGLLLFDSERVNIESAQAWASSRLECDQQARQLVSQYASYYGADICRLRHLPRTQIAWLDAGRKA
jgi:hypothetical protein